MASPQPPAALDPTLESNLKSTLWYQIGRLVDEETINLGVHATPQFIGSLSELVWTQLVSTAGDVEAFARHRTQSSASSSRTSRKNKKKNGGEGEGGDTAKKASTCMVGVKDALLLGRRNEGLRDLLLEEVERLEREREKGLREKGEDKGKGKGKG